MSISNNPSWGSSSSVSGQRSWRTEGSGETQLGQPATQKDLETRRATARTAETLGDIFRSVNTSRPDPMAKLMQAALSGRGIQASDLVGIARFDQTQLLSDLGKLASELSRNPVDTAQNIVFGLPTEAIDRGLRGLEAQTGLKKEFTGSSSGRVGDFHEYRSRQQLGALGTHTNVTRTETGASYETQGRLKVGLAGVNGQGSISGRAGAAVETQGRIQGGAGTLDYSARAGVEVYGRADGNFGVDARGARAQGRAEVGVMAHAEANAKFQSAGVDVGGERLDLRGQGTARVEAGAKAEAHADVAATISPPRVGGEVGASAFAGAKASAEGQVGIGEFATLKGHAGAWAGAGAEAGAVFGLDDGKLRFGFNAGAAVGYGAGAGWGAEIDLKKIANAAIGGSLQAASKGIEYMLNPDKASRDLRHAEKALKDGGKALGRAAKNMHKAVEKEKRKTEKAVRNVAHHASKAIHNVTKHLKLW